MIWEGRGRIETSPVTCEGTNPFFGSKREEEDQRLRTGLHVVRKRKSSLLWGSFEKKEKRALCSGSGGETGGEGRGGCGRKGACSFR